MKMNKEELIKKYSWSEPWIDQMPKGWLASFGDFFFEDLQEALEKSFPDGVPEDFRILQLKEKWGKLRVYLTHEPELVNDVLYAYEYISSFVCINCGLPYPFAQMTYDGWVEPLCEMCYYEQHPDKIDINCTAYLQTVLKDSISVLMGPEDYISIEQYDGEKYTQHKICIKDKWRKIFERFVQTTVV